MRGFAVFLGKEFREIARTWRIWVLPLLIVFVGVSSPILAQITPDLIESLASSQQQAIEITIPEPTTVDAYLQFSKNMMQMVLIAVIIATAGAIASERKSGTAILVLTKPVSRAAMILAKLVSNWVLIGVSTAIGALACWAVTGLLFDGSLAMEFARSTALWLVLAGMFVAVSVLLSVVVNSPSGAAGVGLALFLAAGILDMWGPAREYTFAGLVSAGDRMLLGGEAAVGWPIATALLAIAFCAVAAIVVFRRQEL